MKATKLRMLLTKTMLSFECSLLGSVSSGFSNRKQQKMEVILKDSFCKKCSLQFDNKHLFRQHLSLVHGKMIKTKNEPDTEENVEESDMKEKESSGNVIEKRHKCDICDYFFITKQSLKGHIGSVHEGKKPFNCKICKANFTQKGALNIHVARIHEGKKPFECKICDTSFAIRHDLKVHVDMVHEEKKPFKCNICAVSFSSKAHLKVHVESVHERKKPFKCEICNGCFASKLNLKVHVASIHEGKKAFNCKNCTKRSFE